MPNPNLLPASDARTLATTERARVPAIIYVEAICDDIKRRAKVGYDNTTTWSLPSWHLTEISSELRALGYRVESATVGADSLFIRWDNSETPF